MCEDSDRNKPESQHGYEIDDGSIAASNQEAREARPSPLEGGQNTPLPRSPSPPAEIENSPL